MLIYTILFYTTSKRDGNKYIHKKKNTRQVVGSSTLSLQKEIFQATFLTEKVGVRSYLVYLIYTILLTRRTSRLQFLCVDIID